MTMNKTAAFVASFLLTASLCIAAGYYRELLALPTGGAAPAAPTATFLWHFDEAAGSTNVTDSGSLGLTMTVSNNAKTVASPAKFGNAMSFGVAHDKNHALIPHNSAYNVGTNNWSVDMWINITNATDTLTNATLTCFGGQRPDGKWPFLNIAKRSDDPRWFFRPSSNGVDQTYITTTNMGPNCSNQWLHIAVFRYTNSFHVATNGVISWRLSASGWSFESTNAVGISLGEYKPYSGTFKGAWDEVRLCIGANMPYRGTNFVPPSAPYTGYE